MVNTNLGIVFSVTSMECDGLQIEVAVLIHRCDNILKGGYDAFYGSICCRSKVRGEGVNGTEVEGNDGPATALEVEGSNEGLFCVCD